MFDAKADDRAMWATRTSGEIVSTAREDGSVLVLPVGSIEQHGNHLPVATDTILAHEISALGVERVVDEIPVLLLPPLWSGYSPHHLTFGGTVSLEFDHLLAVLEDVVATALENGFDAVVLVNGHGGNQSAIDGAVSTIGTDHDDVEVLGVTYFQLARSFIDDVRDSELGGMGHGGEFETSLMLYLYEQLVRRDELNGTYLDEPYDLGDEDLLVGGPLAVYRDFDEYSETGAIGDPGLATAEKGEQIYELLGDELERFLRSVHRRNA
ncbi:creatininase family protein [Natrarchaeobius oligotrophus]|uniref:Creatininase family protein n=1 Tax=Natrarchaeobius chitinivorans TaxID=1679083 RepID=A0A3N6MFA4_NATCH|nr:creatininase family protein [Natrarchaeobius chitinivorans]RQH02629.1 creatininase family protein [Natrarchaeobius chitinivorans]